MKSLTNEMATINQIEMNGSLLESLKVFWEQRREDNSHAIKDAMDEAIT